MATYCFFFIILTAESCFLTTQLFRCQYSNSVHCDWPAAAGWVYWRIEGVEMLTSTLWVEKNRTPDWQKTKKKKKKDAAHNLRRTVMAGGRREARSETRRSAIYCIVTPSYIWILTNVVSGNSAGTCRASWSRSQHRTRLCSSLISLIRIRNKSKAVFLSTVSYRPISSPKYGYLSESSLIDYLVYLSAFKVTGCRENGGGNTVICYIVQIGALWIAGEKKNTHPVV